MDTYHNSTIFYFTHPISKAHRVKHYNDLLLGGAGIKSHTSMLGTFFIRTSALCLPIFEKKSLRSAAEKSVKMTFYVLPDFCQIFPELPVEIFFSKNDMGNVRGIAKNVPNIQVHELPPAPPC